MKRALSMLLAAAWSLPAADLAGSFREGNTIFLRLTEGNAQIEWISESSFRYTRQWTGEFTRGPAANPTPVLVSTSETPDALRIASKHVVVTIARRGALLTAADADGETLMSDADPVERRGGAISWERSAPAGTRYFGLGARTGAVELRGGRFAAPKPFLLSSAGYGEFHAAPGDYTFDIARARPDRYRIEARNARRIDYYFFYGPAPKEILEEYLAVEPNGAPVLHYEVSKAADLPARSIDVTRPSLRETIEGLINASLSGYIWPAISLDAYRGAPEPTRRRAAQLASVAPMVIASNRDALRGGLRGDLAAYLDTYAEESRDRGLPLIHPLPLQYRLDAAAAKVTDQFLLGDELLVAPMWDDSKTRSVYLPMGIWTRLSDDRVYQGRQTITIEVGPDELPLFSRNGAIVPLGANPIKLHYFPKLGGEFFIFESDMGIYSQMHASPAGDIFRLEMDSMRDRVYEWIVHHLDKPRSVTAGGREYAEVDNADKLKAGAWFYDAARRNVIVRAMGPAGEHVIINIAW